MKSQEVSGITQAATSAGDAFNIDILFRHFRGLTEC
jgi:hypothetical protein